MKCQHGLSLYALGTVWALIWILGFSVETARADHMGLVLQRSVATGVDVVPDTVVCNPTTERNCLSADKPLANGVAGPIITLWYGSHQVFGQPGNAQQWINVLGNVTGTVSSPPTYTVTLLTYSLNGSPALPLSIGPDSRRLASPGDFNIELSITDTYLISGTNEVVITATDNLTNQSVATATLQYTRGNVWPRPYSVNWASVSNLQDAVQIVDGRWALQADGIRPLVMAYDRVVAVGDLNWDDYEILVPITVHAADPAAYNPISVAPGVGFVMRWQGHTNSPVVCPQPHCGWLPWGASGWYSWEMDNEALSIEGNNGILVKDTSRRIQLDTLYFWRMRVETTVPGYGSYYRLKVWAQSQPEPAQWDLQALGGPNDLERGSAALVAHHVDATWGDITITPGPFADTTPPVISNVHVARGPTYAVVSWTTDEPSTSRVDYGLTSAYGLGSVSNSALAYEHAITVTGLVSDTVYHYRMTSVDPHNNSTSSSDLTFQTTGASTIVSDDFNACALNLGVWTFTDPLGGATASITGSYTPNARLSIFVPAGVGHDIWTGDYTAPRVMQPANDTDFEIEVKFESAVNTEFQTQGILVEQDSGHVLRFDFHSQGASTRIFAASVAPTATIQINQVITATQVAPLYMRVKRQADVWTLSYSLDGANWIIAGRFTHSLMVTAVGVFGGNSAGPGGLVPPYAALVDYFFNTASPITPEDGALNTLVVNHVGSGTVVKSPDLPNYACGQIVTLTATADPDWRFAGWSGGMTGITNPLVLAMTRPTTITATFAHHAIFLPLMMQGQP